jgi:hypothetical protein
MSGKKAILRFAFRCFIACSEQKGHCKTQFQKFWRNFFFYNQRVTCAVLFHDLQIISTNSGSTSIVFDSKPEPQVFTYDYVAGENATQEEVWVNAGKPIVEACLAGMPSATSSNYSVAVRCFHTTQGITVPYSLTDKPVQGKHSQFRSVSPYNSGISSDNSQRSGCHK